MFLFMNPGRRSRVLILRTATLFLEHMAYSVIGVAILSCVSASHAADKPTSSANAAGIVIGAIAGREALISQCRELDVEHATDFDSIYTKYFNSAFAMKLRARDILLAEAKRAGTAEQQIRDLITKIADSVSDEMKQAFRTNPAMFKQRCEDLRGIPLDAINAMTDLRAIYPDAINILEQWH